MRISQSHTENSTQTNNLRIHGKTEVEKKLSDILWHEKNKKAIRVEIEISQEKDNTFICDKQEIVRIIIN